MQGLAALLAVVAFGYGWSAGGPLGALTGAVAVVATGSGLAIAMSESGTGVSESPFKMRIAQQIGGLFCAVASAAGAFYGGWKWGFAWSIGGYILGMLFVLVAALVLGGRSGNLSPGLDENA